MLIKTNTVIHCKTKEEAELFARLSGAVWNGNNGTLLDNDHWYDYKTMTCYRMNYDGRYTYDSLSFYRDETEFVITEFADLLKGTIFENGCVNT